METIRHKVAQAAIDVISHSPHGVRWAQLLRALEERMPEINTGTIQGSARHFLNDPASGVTKLGDGLYAWRGEDAPTDPIDPDHKETADNAQNMWGDKLYQRRAREVLPILVRQALSGKPIYYQHLANELGMSNPRTLNFPLGSVGKTLQELSATWEDPIPPIQCLVINQQDGLPGDGFGWFMDEEGWRRLSKRQRRQLTEKVMQDIYVYPRWMEVLKALELEPISVDLQPLLFKAARMGGNGEGEHHRRLKEYVRHHPELVGVGKRHSPGNVEERLPSGDSIDVFFNAGQEWVGVEVKPESSDPVDLTRGLYQCVKYTAVLRAMAVARQLDVDSRAVLVIGGHLPPELVILKTMLGIEVVEGVRIPDTTRHEADRKQFG